MPLWSKGNKITLWATALAFMFTLQAQDSTKVISYNKKRMTIYASGMAGIYSGTYTGLYFAWYNDFPKTSFHAFDDLPEWKGMDKAGHIYSAYWFAKVHHQALLWTGLNKKKAAWISSGISFGSLLGIEILDGFSSGWGFSFSDLGANTLGAGLHLTQELFLNRTVFWPKIMYAPSPYRSYRPNLLGSSDFQGLLKDYNGQSYWLSFSPLAFKKDARWWEQFLQLSVGYGAVGMTGGRANPMFNEAGNSIPNFNRRSELLFSIDFDWTALPVKNKGAKKWLAILNMLKFPLPALAWREGVGLVTYGLR